MAAPDSKIQSELKHQRHQLAQSLIEELRRTQMKRTEGAQPSQTQNHNFDVKLMVMEKKAELERRLENIQNLQEKNNDKKETIFPSTPKIESAVPPCPNVVYVVAPPTFPAPSVHLDLNDLPAHSCKTQCPECGQYVTTVASSSISSVTCMMCYLLVMLGCVAGCCLIPFCSKKFKTIKHKCPLCRATIKTMTPL